MGDVLGIEVAGVCSLDILALQSPGRPAGRGRHGRAAQRDLLGPLRQPRRGRQPPPHRGPRRRPPRRRLPRPSRPPPHRPRRNPVRRSPRPRHRRRNHRIPLSRSTSHRRSHRHPPNSPPRPPLPTPPRRHHVRRPQKRAPHMRPNIRPAVTADLASVIALDQLCFGRAEGTSATGGEALTTPPFFGDTWSPATWGEEFARLESDRVILVADEGEVVGYVVLLVPEVVEDPVDLLRIAVGPAERRTGVGRQLMSCRVAAVRGPDRPVRSC